MQKKRLSKTFIAYALLGSALLSAGYGIQTAADKFEVIGSNSAAQTTQNIETKPDNSRNRTPNKYSWGSWPRR